MERTLARELGAKVGERIRMQGWLHHQRQLSNVAFLLLRDRSGVAQIVIVDVEGVSIQPFALHMRDVFFG